MQITDAIADMLTRIRNAGSAGHATVDIPTLKYSGRKHVISGIKRISKPGLRTYADKASLPRVLNGLGIAIISTSKGVMTDKEARKLGVGGEVLAYIW